MPDLRTRSIQEAGAIPHSRQGFWIRTAASAAAVPQPTKARRGTATNNKENVNRPWAGTGRRRASPRRSPLPVWYPRAPLRDITNIVQALERRTTQIRRGNALTQPRNHETETPPESEVLQGSPMLREPYAFDHTPPGDVVLQGDISDTSTLTDATLSPSQHSQDTPSATRSSSEESSGLEPSTSLSPRDLQANEYAKKLGNSIDEIEKAVSINLKRQTKVAAKKTTRALMSMR